MTRLVKELRVHLPQSTPSRASSLNITNRCFTAPIVEMSAWTCRFSILRFRGQNTTPVLRTHVVFHHRVLDLYWKVPRIDDVLLINPTVAILLEELVHICNFSPHGTRNFFNYLAVLSLVGALYSVYPAPDLAPLSPRDERASANKVGASWQVEERSNIRT